MTAGPVRRRFLIDRHQRRIFINAGIEHLDARSPSGSTVDGQQYYPASAGNQDILASSLLTTPHGTAIAFHLLPSVDETGMEVIIDLRKCDILPDTIVTAMIGRPIGEVVESGDPLADAALIKECEQDDVRLRITTRADLVKWGRPEATPDDPK